MAIKEPLMFITIEEFKNWKGFNKLEFDEITTPDNEIWFAISIASNNIDYLSGFTISLKWPEKEKTEFTDIVQTATAYYVRFLLTKDSNYIRGQSSISQGGMTYSENNPNDPYYIVPEVFNCLRKIKKYPNITGFNLDVLPKKNDFFSDFYSNYGEDSPLTRYLELINLKSKDPRTKITLERPKYLIGTEVWIDTKGIKSIDNLTTLELFTQYFSDEAMQLVDGKLGQQKKVISLSNKVGELIESKQPMLTSNNAGDNITITGNGSDVKINATGGSTDLTDYYKKEETNNLLDKKQDKLNANVWINIDNNNNINIDEEGYANKIFTFNGYSSVKQLETDNKTIIGAINEIKNSGGNADLTDYYKKSEFSDLHFQNTETLVKLNLNPGLTITTRILNDNKYNQLETTDKTIIGAINEIKNYSSNVDKKYVDDAITEVKNIIEKLVVWKTIGERIDDRTWSNFSPSLKAIYRVFLITETSVPLQNGYKEVIFFTPAYAIGTGTRRITTRKIGNSDATLNMIYDNTKWTLKLDGGDNGGAIFRLEELKAEDVYEIKSATLDIKKSDKMDILKPLNITSETLKITSLAENTFDIELKENPTPNPCPCPKWKEVGIREKNKWDNWQITYDFIENKRYRIYYSWSIYNPVYAIKEFIITDKRIAGIRVDVFNDNENILVLSVNHAKFITIYSLKGKNKGNFLKLEELQE